MPMLAPRNTSLPFTENSGDSVSRIRSATCTASSGAPTSPRTSVNRSPPLRESVSDSLRQPASRSAANWIKVSPARCPSVSLMRLKRSRFRQSSAAIRSAGGRAPRPGETGLRRRIDWDGPLTGRAWPGAPVSVPCACARRCRRAAHPGNASRRVHGRSPRGSTARVESIRIQEHGGCSNHER